MQLDRRHRRIITVIVLASLALAADLQASGLTSLLGGWLLGGAAPGGAGRSPQTTDLAPARRAWEVATGDAHHVVSARPLLDRNPFDSSSPRPLDGPGESSATSGHDDELPACDGMKATLVACFPGESVLSMAALTATIESGAATSVPERGRPARGAIDALAAGDRARARLVHPGESVGERTVRSVEWNRVVLSSEESSCEIRMYHARSVSEEPAGGETMQGIRSVRPGEVEVDRAMLDRVLANPFGFLQGTRIVPEEENGAIVGIRVFGVRPGSLLMTLGLQNGDRLDSVNGLAVGTPEQMMTAYGRLAAAEQVDVRLNRGGRTVELDVRVR